MHLPRVSSRVCSLSTNSFANVAYVCSHTKTTHNSEHCLTMACTQNVSTQRHRCHGVWTLFWPPKIALTSLFGFRFGSSLCNVAYSTLTTWSSLRGCSSTLAAKNKAAAEMSCTMGKRSCHVVSRLTKATNTESSYLHSCETLSKSG